MSIVSGSSSLIIRGKDRLDFNEIREKLNFESTEEYRRGDKFSKHSEEISRDVWIYTVKCKKNQEPNKALNELLSTFIPYEKSINELSKTNEIYIRTYVQSDLDQIGFDFSPETIEMLAELKIRFEISIISWGEAETE